MNKSVLLVVVIVIVAAAGGAGYYLMQNIDGVVKQLIEEVGSETTTTDVRLQGVKLDLIEGSGSLQGLTVANPEGFSAESLVSMDNIDVVIDTASLTEDVKVIKRISIDGARVLTEQVGGGTNIQALMNQMESAGGGDTESSSDSGSETLLAVEEMSFTNGQLQLRSDLFGERSLTLPDFTVKNLGSAEQGLTAEELGTEIAAELLGEVKDAVMDQISDLAKEAAADKLKEKLSDSAAEGLNKLKGLFNKKD